MMNKLNERVQHLLNTLVETSEEIGLQVAVYLNEELVVDTWAGIADTATGRPVDGDTLFTVWSTTKGFTATCLHILADRGQVEYDTPIAAYWPEFAMHGKEKVTVRHALTHTAGIPHMPTGVTPEMLTHWETMCQAVAALEPLWEPGSKTGYHAWTFGWIIGELIRRVDGRPIAQFAYDELCQPLGIEDFYLGIPDEVEHRIATLQAGTPPDDSPEPSDLTLQALPPHVTSAQVMNRSDIRRACLPATGGIMNARAIARHYAILANKGVLDGVRIVSADRIEVMRSLQTQAVDEVLGNPRRKGLGYFLSSAEDSAMGTRGGEFGHPGLGGFLGFADPERKLGFGFTKTLLKTESDPTKRAAFVIATAIRTHLDHIG